MIWISYTQQFHFSDAKRYEEIKEDLVNLLNLELQITSITCDGHKATLKAIKKSLLPLQINKANKGIYSEIITNHFSVHYLI